MLRWIPLAVVAVALAGCSRHAEVDALPDELAGHATPAEEALFVQLRVDAAAGGGIVDVSQSEALADWKVTPAEHAAVLERTLACMKAGGITSVEEMEVADPPYRIVRWNVVPAAEVASVDRRTYDGCYSKYEELVEVFYVQQIRVLSRA